MKEQDAQVGAVVRLGYPVETSVRGLHCRIEAGALATIVDVYRADDDWYLVEFAEPQGQRVRMEYHDLPHVELVTAAPRAPRETSSKQCKARGCGRMTTDPSGLCWQHRDMR